MSAQPLVSVESATKLLFPDLARNIRENLGEARATGAHRLNEEVLQKLLRILQDKIGDEQPPRTELPPAPVPPFQPKLPDLPIPSTDEYNSCRLYFTKQITALQRVPQPPSKKANKKARRKISALKQEMRAALTRIALENQPPEFQAKWREVTRIRESFPLRRREHRRALQAYYRRTAPQRRARDEWQTRYGKNGTDRKLCLRIIDHLRDDVSAYGRGEYAWPIEKLPWRFLPPGPNGIVRVAQEIRELRKRYPHLNYDEERLHHAQSLQPSHVYVGVDEFEGYFAFVFEKTEFVLLENPQEGNAAYIFKRDWTSLSKLPKFELLNRYPHCVERVLHREFGNWRWRIKRALKLR